MSDRRLSEESHTHSGSELADLKIMVQSLSDRIGKESDDGKSGTGLVGEVRRVSQDMASLKSLKDRGLGAVAAIVLVLAIIALGFKQGFSQLLSIIPK